MKLNGKYNTAEVFTENIEEEAISQIINIMNQEWSKDSKICIMPDVHAGKGCTVGTTMTIKDKIVPSIVGVDIGCGMLTMKLKNKFIDLEQLDKFIHTKIPSGTSVRSSNHLFSKELNLEKLICFKSINYNRAMMSCGTLGGGNHFIEVGKDYNNDLYLVIHSGSRQLGLQICNHYIDIAYNKIVDRTKERESVINDLRREGREKEIEKVLRSLDLNKIAVSKELAWLEGQDFDDYIHDMKIAQNYAKLNRLAMAKDICHGLDLDVVEDFDTIHNYVDTENMILRKGAISCQEGEKVLIPMNMRDGSIIGIGKGNIDWNYSGPHGAGRLMSRSTAKKTLDIDDYKDTMKDVYSSCVNNSTLDEAPMAYKPMDEIIQNIKDTIEVIEIIKPIYNFKAQE